MKRLQKQKTKLQPPPMYKVVLNNDDYTPMEFVVEVLQKFFGMDLDKATQVMLSVHYSGKESVARSPPRLPKPKWSRSTPMHVTTNIHCCVPWKRLESDDLMAMTTPHCCCTRGGAYVE